MSAGWQHEWSEDLQDYTDFAPTRGAETAFAHELLHHATSLPDNDEFETILGRVYILIDELR